MKNISVLVTAAGSRGSEAGADCSKKGYKVVVAKVARSVAHGSIMGSTPFALFKRYATP